jgi:hypothetical protein
MSQNKACEEFSERVASNLRANVLSAGLALSIICTNGLSLAPSHCSSHTGLAWPVISFISLRFVSDWIALLSEVNLGRAER